MNTAPSTRSTVSNEASLPSSTSPPTSETDNWDSTSIEAPRQKAGEVIERRSEAADPGGAAIDSRAQERLAADAEALAERQAATDDGSVEPA